MSTFIMRSSYENDGDQVEIVKEWAGGITIRVRQGSSSPLSSVTMTQSDWNCLINGTIKPAGS